MKPINKKFTTRNATKWGAYALLILSVFFLSCNDDDESDQPNEYTIEIKESINMPSGGKITSQYADSPAGADAGKMLDNDYNTDFISPHSNFYVMWSGERTVEVESYSLVSSNNAPENDPKSWKFSGSRDRKNWILLDTQTNQAFEERGKKYSYPIKDETKYKYYKLEIVANNGSASTHIAEWLISEPDIELNIKDLLNRCREYKATTTPTGTIGSQFANWPVQEASAAQKAWLEDPTKEPNPEGGTSLNYNNSYTVNLYPYGIPYPADANQTTLNNCGQVAALASLAYLYPNFIKEYLITKVSDTHFDVKMFDPRGNKITVAVSNKFMGAATKGKNGVATWATVLEKAGIKHRQVYKGSPNVGGSGLGQIMPPFTGVGTSYGTESGDFTHEEFQRLVRVSLAKGWFVIGGWGATSLGQTFEIRPGISTIRMHTFSMSQTSAAGSMFAMRNPWGHWSGAKDGVVDIPATSLMAQTVNVTVMEPGLPGTGQWDKVGVTDPYDIPF